MRQGSARAECFSITASWGKLPHLAYHSDRPSLPVGAHGRFSLRVQPVDATDWANRQAGFQKVWVIAAPVQSRHDYIPGSSHWAGRGLC